VREGEERGSEGKGKKEEGREGDPLDLPPPLGKISWLRHYLGNLAFNSGRKPKLLVRSDFLTVIM